MVLCALMQAPVAITDLKTDVHIIHNVYSNDEGVLPLIPTYMYVPTSTCVVKSCDAVYTWYIYLPCASLQSQCDSAHQQFLTMCPTPSLWSTYIRAVAHMRLVNTSTCSYIQYLSLTRTSVGKVPGIRAFVRAQRTLDME